MFLIVWNKKIFKHYGFCYYPRKNLKFHEIEFITSTKINVMGYVPKVVERGGAFVLKSEYQK